MLHLHTGTCEELYYARRLCPTIDNRMIMERFWNLTNKTCLREGNQQTQIKFFIETERKKLDKISRERMRMGCFIKGKSPKVNPPFGGDAT